MPAVFHLLAVPVLLSLSALAANAQEPVAPVMPPATSAAKLPLAATPPVEKPEPGAPKPFKDVLKGAKESKGLFTLHAKDEKIWIEIKPEQLNKPFFFSVNIPSSVGQRGLYASQMGNSHIVVFRKIGNQLQLIAKNSEYIAKPGTPQAIAVAQAFSDSLLASAPLASAPHPETKAILVDASLLLFSDIPSYSTRLDYVYRLPFAFDRTNTSFTKARTDDALTGFHVNAHFFMPKIPAPPLTPPPVPQPSPPSTTPDPRSLFVGFYYSLTELPKAPMHSRVADDRVGHFVTTHYDYTNDFVANPALHTVNRWRLEKKDPAAVLSEPKTPIIYWLDKNIPEKYRKSISAGVLEWNLAFERIGFKNAVVVKQQSEKDDFDTLDARHASIRWFVGSDVGFAIGPSQVDPRSGEILDADIGMSDLFPRLARRLIGEDGALASPAPGLASIARGDCAYFQDSAQEMGFAFGLLEARGTFETDGPEAEALAQEYVKNVIMHEIGHTLGLRHNFRSSGIYTLQQIQNPEFTKKYGVAGSVMDYNALNIATQGEKQGEYVMSTLGPYDYWAIEYAYRPLDEASERQELNKIAARSIEPQLAYGTDEDAHGFMSDPAVNLFDLGDDPLSFLQRRLLLSRELWDRLQSRQLKVGESYESLRRSFDYGFFQLARTLPIVGKHIGGITYLRDHFGTGRNTFAPVPVARQRAALTILTNQLFKPDSFKFTPELLSRLGTDHFERQPRADLSIASYVLAMQAATLDHLMSDAVAVRLLDSQEKVVDGKNVLALSELYETLQGAIWSELKNGKDIPSMRRNLQREHVKRVANTLLRPMATTPADARSLQRQNALALQKQIQAGLKKPLGKEASAHLAESLNTLGDALKAGLLRAGV